MSHIKTNSFYSLLGFLIPTLVMLASYPILVHHLGVVAFGVYSLATSISGTLAFLDFGFSTATVKFIAEDIAKQDHQSAADVISTSLVFYGGIGLLGAFVIWFLSPWLVTVFSISPSMQLESIWVFRISSIQFAVFFITTVFISLFKGFQKFDISSVLLLLLSILTLGVPAIAVYRFQVGLLFVTMISLVGNIAVLILSVILSLHLCNKSKIPLYKTWPSNDTFRRMIEFGSAMGFSSIAGILHAHVQRMLISSLLGPAYVTSFTLGVWGPAKLNGATLAISEPLFPRIASLTNKRQKGYVKELYYRYFIVLFIFSLIVFFPMIFYSKELFFLWMGADVPKFAPQIASILSVGLLFNILSQPAYHALNGIGKPLINTLFTLASPVVLYSVLAFLFFFGGRLNILNFAWATSISLILTSVCFLIWFEVRILKTFENEQRKSLIVAPEE